MESGEGDTGGNGMVESETQDFCVPEEQLSGVNGHYKNGSNGNLPLENSVSDNNQGSDDSHDQLLQMVVELRFQNEFLKSQFEGFSNISSAHSDSSQNNRVGALEDGESDVMNELEERIQSLNKELEEEKQTRHASEEALTHLQTVYSETETKAQELSKKLPEAQTKLDQQTKEHEDKYCELDLKFNRLHKRAKQRIQEIQKEKDDLEARFSKVNETAERASAQQSALQQELERTRKQANEALKATDGDRQQLRSANNKLRDNIEDLRRSLQPKENAFEALQLSLTEKEQMLKDMKGLLQDADEKRQASLAELSAKHQKSLEAQLNDAFSDRSEATESISSLQEKERESWETASQALKAKLEIAEGNCIRAEVEVAKIRSQLESEVSAQASILSMRDAELLAVRKSSLEREFSSYKVRAHALLQKKDAELAAAKDSEQIKALEDALKEADNEISSTTEEKDKVLEDLQSAMANHVKELTERDAGLENAKQQIRSLETRLDSANAQHLKEKEAWGLSLQNVEETWRIRCEEMKAENEATTTQGIIQKEFEELKQQYKKLKEEHASFHDLADRTIEEKDNEISRLVDDNKNLRQSLQSRSQILARQQAQREEELARSQRHILALQEEIEELERGNRLHSQQEAMLKTELRNMERAKKREGVDMTYLKNVILKLLETGEVEVLLPVIGMLLQFSPEEMQKCQQAYQNSTDVPPTPASDASGSSGLSLFSRFSFS
ncbi:unnamed protein product [Lupinus luteus]|uniref:GRIP domain-containing protein n=1 Tax=Lupinus luteus TaxID=3873 RepID=A0AAV1YGA0_LUPLU